MNKYYVHIDGVRGEAVCVRPHDTIDRFFMDKYLYWDWSVRPDTYGTASYFSFVSVIFFMSDYEKGGDNDGRRKK